jgi:hypothetical protein
MNPLKYFILSFYLALLLDPDSCKTSGSDNSIRGVNGGLTLPPGFSASVFADKLGPGRHIAARNNGDIYLALSTLKNGKGIVALRDNNGDDKADSIKYLARHLR